MIDLSSKVALITGAARGIGAATAEFFAEQGAHVLMTDILDGPGEEVAMRIRTGGGQAFCKRSINHALPMASSI